MKAHSQQKTVVLVGIAGSNNAFSLSLYNLKAYALADPEIKKHWRMPVIQRPLINFGTNESLAQEKVDQSTKQVAPAN